MVEDQGKEEEKFDFTREGEVVSYISLTQARLLAMQTASETPGNYGRRYQNVPMVFETVDDTENEDYYVLTLSFRPQGDFSGIPGKEQFFIEKEGTVAVRQVLNLPKGRGKPRLPVLPVAIGLVIVGVITGVAVIFADGGFGNGVGMAAELDPTKIPIPTVISVSTPIPTHVPTANPRPTYTPLPTYTPRPTPKARVILATPTPTPTRRPTPTPNSGYYFDKGHDYGRDGKYQLAINEYTTAIRLNPYASASYNNRGVAYHNLGQYERSIQDYDKAIQIDPTYALAYNNRGVAYHNLNQYKRSIQDYDKAIQIDPTYALAYTGRGKAYDALGQHAKANADKAKACSLDSQYC